MGEQAITRVGVWVCLDTVLRGIPCEAVRYHSWRLFWVVKRVTDETAPWAVVEVQDAALRQDPVAQLLV